jgi:Cu(I)/Ag(I) efflux system membrane protein CusA/SilA
LLIAIFRAVEAAHGCKTIHNTTQVIEGAVSRVRPKILAVSAILFGLLPIMWSPAMQAGAEKGDKGSRLT